MSIRPRTNMVSLRMHRSIRGGFVLVRRTVAAILVTHVFAVSSFSQTTDSRESEIAPFTHQNQDPQESTPSALAFSPPSPRNEPQPLPDVPAPQTANIIGTVTDANNDTLPGATVVLDGPVLKDHRTAVANDNGFYELKDLEPGIPSPFSGVLSDADQELRRHSYSPRRTLPVRARDARHCKRLIWRSCRAARDQPDRRRASILRRIRHARHSPPAR